MEIVEVDWAEGVREKIITKHRLDPEEDALYGLYHGVPLPEREFNYGNALPDRIVLYQDVIEEDAADEPEIREIAQETVVHEVGHYFGLSDEEMEEWEAGGWRE